MLLLEWKASSDVAYLDYYYDYDASEMAHSDSLDVSRAKIVDTHDVTIAETMDAPMFLSLPTNVCVCVRFRECATVNVFIFGFICCQLFRLSASFFRLVIFQSSDDFCDITRAIAK